MHSIAENSLASTLHVHSFSVHNVDSINSISAINPAIMDNMDYLIVKCVPQLSIKIVGVLLCYSVILRIIFSCFEHFGSKE